MEPWVEVQKNTFTKWVNYRLRNTDFLVEDLAKDLENGLVLIQLLEVLTGKTVPGKYVKLYFMYACIILCWAPLVAYCCLGI